MVFDHSDKGFRGTRRFSQEQQSRRKEDGPLPKGRALAGEERGAQRKGGRRSPRKGGGGRRTEPEEEKGERHRGWAPLVVGFISLTKKLVRF